MKVFSIKYYEIDDIKSDVAQFLYNRLVSFILLLFLRSYFPIKPFCDRPRLANLTLNVTRLNYIHRLAECT